MARKLELNHDQASILSNRVFISRSIGIFTLRQLTDGWSISLTTLHRYKSPQYREYSRENARRSYTSYRQGIARGLCFRCDEDLTDHERCSSCTILTHNGAPTCGTAYCIATRQGERIGKYQPVASLV